MKSIKSIVAISFVLILSACGSLVTGSIFKPITIELVSSADPVDRYDNLTHGLNLAVVSKVSNSIVDNSELDSKARKMVELIEMNIDPTVKMFVESSMSSYIKRMGIKLNNDNISDYKLRVNVTEFKVVHGSSSDRATVVLEYVLSDSDNDKIFSKTARGTYTLTNKDNEKSPIKKIYNSSGLIVDAIDKAYALALEDMDWQEIADALTTHKNARQENNRQVTGNGDTALEHTVIRWFIDSTPKGADVSWRVVSSTPDVKNTNSTYVGTTPYETTESFDIRGLTYENAGNLQLEVTCEKAGYLTQKRRFNLRQAIDQREISAKFNLVKDDE